MANTARRGPFRQGDDGRRPAAPYHGMSADAQSLSASEDRQWATMSHFGGILGFLPSLVIYLVMRDRGPFTAQESKEALNFTLPPTVLAILANLLALIDGVGSIFAVIAALIWLTVTIFSVRAGIRVNRGEPHRYVFNLRLIH